MARRRREESGCDMFKKMFEKLKTRKNLALLCVAIGAITYYILLNKLSSVFGFLAKIVGIISPFIWGGVIAFLLNPIAKFFERRIFGKMKKQRAAHTLSVLLTVVLTLAVLAVLMITILPQIASSVMMLINNLENYFSILKNTLQNLVQKLPFLDAETIDIDSLIGSWEELFTTVSNWVVNNVDSIIGVSYKVGSGLFNTFIAFIFSIYVLLDKKDLKRFARRISAALLPEKPLKRFGEIVRKSNAIFLKYIGGNLLDALIVGVANYIFMLIMGMPYALLISAIVGVTNFIPTFGPIIGAVPSALILLLVDPWKALWFIIFTLVLQFLDGNVIKPLLFSDSTGLRPVWVLVSIIIGGRVMGIVGMLIGIPVFAIISFLLDEALAERLPAKGYDTDGHRLSGNTDEEADDGKTVINVILAPNQEETEPDGQTDGEKTD